VFIGKKKTVRKKQMGLTIVLTDPSAKKKKKTK